MVYGRKNDGFFNETNILNFHQYDETLFTNYLEQENYLFIIKPHPSEETKLAKLTHPNILFLDNQSMTNSRHIY